MRNTLGTYTPNYNLYMPSIGEQGWGELVSNNFEILDTNLNGLQTQIDTINTQIDTINTNIGDGTRILSIGSPPITTSNFGNYAYYDENNVYIAQFGKNTIIESTSKPPHSCRLMIIVVNGDLTINGNIDTYPTSLQSELPPNDEITNTYTREIHINNFSSYTLTYTANGNNSQLIMNYDDYIKFVGKLYTLYTLSIPHAIAAGGGRKQNGTAGTAENTCNGGGGGNNNYSGGTGCIFGQYSGGNGDGYGYGYGSDTTNKYRCGLIFVVNGNLIINESCTITQNGGGGGNNIGGYGGGADYAGGGGAPVFIYYTGTYVNNGTINIAGGNRSSDCGICGDGGAGGIKVTKITL